MLARRRNIGGRRRARIAGAKIDPVGRRDIIERFGTVCYLCGNNVEPDDIHIDHVHPLSKGGSHTIDNLRVACSRCNTRKGSLMLSDYLATLPADQRSRVNPHA
jgi:5-methylcytosine-specific restriction endonuclease McrA